MDINWDLLIKAIAAVVGFVVSISQIRHRLPRPRAHLRADLEILKLAIFDYPRKKVKQEFW